MTICNKTNWRRTLTKSDEWDKREKERTHKHRDMGRIREIFYRAVKTYERDHKFKTGCNAVKINISPDYTLNIFRCQICGHDFLKDGRP